MKMRSTTLDKSTIQQLPKPSNLFRMKKRVYDLKHRSLNKTLIVRNNNNTLSNTIDQQKLQHFPKPLDIQNDNNTTNFWPSKQGTPPSSSQTITQRQFQHLPQKRSYDSKLILIKPTMNISRINSRFRTLKKINKIHDIQTYQKQINYFAQLYQLLAHVLASIQKGLQSVQTAISKYCLFIRNAYLIFIDDFISDKPQKIKKSFRISRIYQYLSIAYLFLQIAQNRIVNNQSYLINFIGFSLSNLIFLTKIYILSQKKSQYPQFQIQRQINQYQRVQYDQILTNVDDIMFRVQHNNQIITMIHKKLGKYNQAFQSCINQFLKSFQIKKYTTLLCSHHIFQFLAMHIHSVQLVGISPFLQVSPTPYLAPPKHDYTLVFQPLGIMKHAQKQKLRPYLLQFIQWANKYFDLVLWTWQMPNYNQPIFQLLQPYLFAKLYRFHCIIKNDVFTKDLNRLGRNIKKTLILDYDQRIFADTPKNGFVARWKGNQHDKGLLIISEILQEMIKSQSDVSDMLAFYVEEIHNIRGI